jgi:hypothetical protein
MRGPARRKTLRQRGRVLVVVLVVSLCYVAVAVGSIQQTGRQAGSQAVSHWTALEWIWRYVWMVLAGWRGSGSG